MRISVDDMHILHQLNVCTLFNCVDYYACIPCVSTCTIRFDNKKDLSEHTQIVQYICLSFCVCFSISLLIVLRWLLLKLKSRTRAFSSVKFVINNCALSKRTINCLFGSANRSNQKPNIEDPYWMMCDVCRVVILRPETHTHDSIRQSKNK